MRIKKSSQIKSLRQYELSNVRIAVEVGLFTIASVAWTLWCTHTLYHWF